MRNHGNSVCVEIMGRRLHLLEAAHRLIPGGFSHEGASHLMGDLQRQGAVVARQASLVSPWQVFHLRRSAPLHAYRTRVIAMRHVTKSPGDQRFGARRAPSSGLACPCGGGLCRFLDVDQSAAPLAQSSQSSWLSMGTPVATVTAKGGCGDQSCGNSAYCVVCFRFGARRWNAKPRTTVLAVALLSGARAWPAASGQKTKSARHCAGTIGGAASFGHTVRATLLTRTLTH